MTAVFAETWAAATLMGKLPLLFHTLIDVVLTPRRCTGPSWSQDLRYTARR